jgi:hypothetical protein
MIEELLQLVRHLPERWRILHHLIRDPVYIGGSIGNRNFRVQQLPLYLLLPIGHDLHNGYFHYPVSPEIDPRRLKIQDR